MTEINELKTELGLPPLHQIGFIVRNLDRVVRSYSSILGIGPFTVYEFTPDKHWFRGESCHFKANYGKAMLGDIELCFMQPLEGRSIHNEFLETRGEGLFNLGFLVPNYDEMFERFVKAGFEPLAQAESYVETYKGSLKGCYFETWEMGEVLFEIMWKSWLMEG